MFRRFFRRAQAHAQSRDAGAFFKALFTTDFEGVDEFGRSSLHYAALGGQSEHMLMLLARSPSLVLPCNQGWTPLHCAAHAQSVACVSLLLEGGVLVDPQDQYGNTPLWRAVFESKGHGEVIAVLREAGADPCRSNKHGVSPLKLARTIANYPVAPFFSDMPDDAG